MSEQAAGINTSALAQEGSSPFAQIESQPSQLQQELLIQTTPDQVRQKLQSDLDLLRAQRTKLDYDLANNNCIRINLLWRDWSGEEACLRGAIDGIDSGNNNQAVVYLEEQVAQRLVDVQQLDTDNARRSINLEDDIGRYRQAREQLPVADDVRKRYLSGNLAEENVRRRYEEIEQQQIENQLRDEHPEWVDGNKLKDVKVRYAGVDVDIVERERERIGRLRSLTTSDFIAQRADNTSLSPEDRYMYLRYAEIRASEEWLEEHQRTDGYRQAYQRDIDDLDRMITSIGGTPLSANERQTRVHEILIDPASDLSPEDRYNHILQSVDNSLDAAGEQINHTYTRLRAEQARIEQHLRRIQKDTTRTEDIQSFQRQQDRISFLLLRTDYVFAEHCKRQGIPESLPYLETLKSETTEKNQKKENLVLEEAYVVQGLDLIRQNKLDQAIKLFENIQVANDQFNLSIVNGVDTPISHLLSDEDVARAARNVAFSSSSKVNEYRISLSPYSIARDLQYQFIQRLMAGEPIDFNNEILSFDKYPERYKPEFIEKLKYEVVLIRAEEWIHHMQKLKGENLTENQDDEGDIAVYLDSKGVILTNDFLSRHESRVLWYCAKYPDKAKEVQEYFKKVNG